ncbi:hypothetical protein [Stieleria mannarensis]|uniref:hypothetical protein n=1 Tax=Stieleria mannarensis TaxID=2755585 RepID=UPI0016006AAB|nr:hypothetical protein [Rhodopirellula sp. JC639]
MQPSNLATVVRAILPRILASGVTTEEEVDIATLQQRLDAERYETNASYVGELKFAAFARPPPR